MSAALYLDGSSEWYVQAANALHTFELQTTLPQGWVSLSQGEETANGWRETHPQDSIYLLAGKFHVYRQAGKHATALVYLQTADEALAQQYLQTSPTVSGSIFHLAGRLPLPQVRHGGKFLGNGLGDAVLHPAGVTGNALAVHPALLVSA